MWISDTTQQQFTRLDNRPCAVPLERSKLDKFMSRKGILEGDIIA